MIGSALLKPVAAAETGPAQAEWEEAPLHDLGLVQLVQRLGSALEKRRARALSEPPAPAPLVVPATGVEAAEAEEAAQAMAAYFGASRASEPDAPDPAVVTAAEQAGEAYGAEHEPTLPPSVLDGGPGALHGQDRDGQGRDGQGLRPAFLASLATSGEGDDDDEPEPYPDFSLPLRRPSAGPAVTDMEDTGGDDDGAGDDEGFPSLLSLRSHAPSEKKFVRIDDLEHPVPAAPPSGDPSEQRLFDPPGGARAPARENDAALRAALATLQRMSGTA